MSGVHVYLFRTEQVLFLHQLTYLYPAALIQSLTDVSVTLLSARLDLELCDINAL